MIKNILILLRGSALAQIITALAMPIVTHLYDPSQFGVFSIVLSIISIATVVVTFKIDQAIPISDSKDEVNMLLGTSLINTILISLTVIIVSYALALYIEGYSEIKNYILFIGITVFLLGLKRIFTSLTIYTEDYNLNSNSQVIQSSLIVCGQILLSSFGTIGLVISQPIGTLFSNIYYFRKYRKNNNDFRFNFKFKAYINTLKEYKDFVLLLTPATFINTLGSNLPIFILPLYFSNSSVGLYAMAMRILLTPFSMIGQAISQPFIRTLKEHFGNRMETTDVILKVILNMSLFILPTIVIINVFSFNYLHIILGEEWIQLKFIFLIISPWIITIFINLPLTNIYNVYRKHTFNIVYNIVSLFLKTLTLIVGSVYLEFFEVIIFYSGISILLGIFQFFLLLNISQVDKIFILKKICKVLTLYLLTITVFIFSIYLCANNDFVIFLSTFLFILVYASIWYIRRKLK